MGYAVNALDDEEVAGTVTAVSFFKNMRTAEDAHACWRIVNFASS